MKTLLSSIAIVSMLLLSPYAHSGISLAKGLVLFNGVALANGLYVKGVDPTVNLRGLAQAPLVKAD